MLRGGPRRRRARPTRCSDRVAHALLSSSTSTDFSQSAPGERGQQKARDEETCSATVSLRDTQIRTRRRRGSCGISLRTPPLGDPQHGYPIISRWCRAPGASSWSARALVRGMATQQRVLDVILREHRETLAPGNAPPSGVRVAARSRCSRRSTRGSAAASPALSERTSETHDWRHWARHHRPGWDQPLLADRRSEPCVGLLRSFASARKRIWCPRARPCRAAGPPRLASAGPRSP